MMHLITQPKEDLFLYERKSAAGIPGFTRSNVRINIAAAYDVKMAFMTKHSTLPPLSFMNNTSDSGAL